MSPKDRAHRYQEEAKPCEDAHTQILEDDSADEGQWRTGHLCLCPDGSTHCPLVSDRDPVTQLALIVPHDNASQALFSSTGFFRL